MQKLNLRLTAFRTFVMGVEAGSFAIAAERAGRSPSAVSAQLKNWKARSAAP